MPWEMRH